MPNSSLLASSLAKFGGLLRVVGVTAFLLAAFIPATVSAEQSGSGPYRFHNVVIGGGGGFIPGIVFSTTEPGLVYTRTDIGGAYRFDQDSGLWVPLLDWIGFPDWNLSGVESIAIDPRDPHRVYLAVGTYTNEWASQNGAILRSDNQGRTFRRFDLPFKVGSNMPGRGMGERLAIDPNNTRILYLGTRSGHGLWRSLDSGETWSQVSSFPDTGPYHEPSGGPSDTYDNDPIGVARGHFRSAHNCERRA
jgi:xyloglucan-specific exo-beta-1,4-glucanase